jgi:hypothetical protein
MASSLAGAGVPGMVAGGAVSAALLIGLGGRLAQEPAKASVVTNSAAARAKRLRDGSLGAGGGILREGTRRRA